MEGKHSEDLPRGLSLRDQFSKSSPQETLGGKLFPNNRLECLPKLQTLKNLGGLKIVTLSLTDFSQRGKFLQGWNNFEEVEENC